MVHRVINWEASVSANGTDEQLNSQSPREGNQWNVEEIWFRNASEGEFTVSLRERNLINDLDTQAAPTESERLLVNWTVSFGENLDVLGTDESGSSNEMAMYALVDEVEASG